MMHSEPYLPRLTARLTEGLSRLSDEARARHAGYLRGCQNPDGGFPDREGHSDLYYTGFALRGLAVLGELTPAIADATAPYLKASLRSQASVIDLFSLLYGCLLVQVSGGPDVLADSPADWPDRVAAVLETFHTPDGGYNKTANAASGSTYHTFLVGLSYQLLGRAFPDPDGVRQFLTARRRDDGGFVEVSAMRRSGTNPTAAAVGAWQLLGDPLPDDVRDGVVEYLADLPSDEGGLRANPRVPLADLLSTFTGAWTLAQLDALDRIDLPALKRYVEMLEDHGGFRGGLWDERTDVEYTFYGLGVLALV